MKKMSVVLIALSLAVFTFSSASAGNSSGGMDGGCRNCAKDGATTPSEPFRKFQADTIDLRQEMMTKRFEMQRENLKAAPDSDKITALQAYIKLLQTKIMAVRAQSGLPVDKSDGECGQKSGGTGLKGMGGCGKEMGGCNRPCDGQK